MPITSMSIKGCYEELNNLKDVGIFSPARDYMSILITEIYTICLPYEHAYLYTTDMLLL